MQNETLKALFFFGTVTERKWHKLPNGITKTSMTVILNDAYTLCSYSMKKLFFLYFLKYLPFLATVINRLNELNSLLINFIY